MPTLIHARIEGTACPVHGGRINPEVFMAMFFPDRWGAVEGVLRRWELRPDTDLSIFTLLLALCRVVATTKVESTKDHEALLRCCGILLPLASHLVLPVTSRDQTSQVLVYRSRKGGGAIAKVHQGIRERAAKARMYGEAFDLASVGVCKLVLHNFGLSIHIASLNANANFE